MLGNIYSDIYKYLYRRFERFNHKCLMLVRYYSKVVQFRRFLECQKTPNDLDLSNSNSRSLACSCFLSNILVLIQLLGDIAMINVNYDMHVNIYYRLLLITILFILFLYHDFICDNFDMFFFTKLKKQLCMLFFYKNLGDFASYLVIVLLIPKFL